MTSASLLKNFKMAIPKLHQEMHKGQAGRVGIVGGSKEYVTSSNERQAPRMSQFNEFMCHLGIRVRHTSRQSVLCERAPICLMSSPRKAQRPSLSLTVLSSSCCLFCELSIFIEDTFVFIITFSVSFRFLQGLR